MWILLWVILSAILIGSSLWSLRILLNQKAAWEKYSKQNGFIFSKGTFMGPAEMSGVVGEYKVSLFTAERQTTDVRMRRYLTVMEINLMDGLVDGGVAGTPEMLTFMQSLDRLHPFKMDYPGWEAGHNVFVRNDDAIRAYLTPERVETVAQILRTRNADVILIFNDKEIVVRMETSDPLQDADKIDKIVKRQIALVDKLRITAEQRDAYQRLSPPAPVPVTTA